MQNSRVIREEEATTTDEHAEHVSVLVPADWDRRLNAIVTREKDNLDYALFELKIPLAEVLAKIAKRIITEQ